MPPFQKSKTLRHNAIRYAVSALVALLFLGYPFLVYFGLDYFEPRVLYAVLGGIVLVRFALRIPRLRTRNVLRALSPLAAIGALVVIGITTNSKLYMLFLPALITVSLAAVFGYSLYSGPSMIETFARMEVADLTEDDVTYCWNVTLVWVGFLLINSTLVVLLALGAEANVTLAGYDSLTLWTLYTGAVSYVLVGVLFGVEFLYRKWKFRRFQGSLLDRILREIIPPRGGVVKTFVPLDKLNVHGRRGGFPVARGTQSLREWNEFNSRVSGLLEELTERPGETWVLSCRDGFAFAVGLMGIWQSGGEVILPPSEQSETLSSVTGEADGVVTDSPDAFATEETIDPLVRGGSYDSLTILDPESTCLRLFTSGSSGQRKAIPKTLAHLQREIEILEEQWSSILEQSSIVSTVSHQHIYGLLHKILWPLAAGRQFESESVMYPRDLIDRIRNQSAATLVTTPTHLETFVEHEEFESLGGILRAIFSSGGPLSKSTVDRVYERIGLYPCEILGSTETGGVAWRRQDGERNPWIPLRNVEVKPSRNNTLMVRSPWASTISEGWHDMLDRVEFCDDDRFILKGRADRVENIAEKRVDLTELESRAEEHERVREAAAVVIEDTTDASQRRRVKMAIVTDAGSETSSSYDLQKKLRSYLLDYFEPVVIPRDVKIVENLPRNTEGKVTVPALKELFDRVGPSS